jgi:hypothetical protein
VLVIHETTLELEMHDLDHLVICWCIKYRHLACQEGGFALCFPLDVSMVHSSMLVVATYDERLTCGGFSLSETVHFGMLEFVTEPPQK